MESTGHTSTLHPKVEYPILGFLVAMPSSDTIDIVALAREIATRMAPDALLDSQDVAALLKCSPRYVTESFALAPGFPKAIRLAGVDGSRSRPRWYRAEIMAWIEAQSYSTRARGGPRRKR